MGLPLVVVVIIVVLGCGGDGPATKVLFVCHSHMILVLSHLDSLLLSTYQTYMPR